MKVLIYTLSIPGKRGLGPLDENEATLGDSTPFPTTVTVGETFTTGFLAWHGKMHMIEYF
jgi:hypothetical protein